MNTTITTPTGNMIVNTDSILDGETITDIISSMTTPEQFEKLIESDAEWSSDYETLVNQIKQAIKSL